MVRIVGKGNQPALIPLAPRTARAIDVVVGERTDGPLLTRSDGSRLDRHVAGRIVRRLAKRAGIDSQVDLDAIAAELNGRPRKTLEYMTRSEKYAEAGAATR